jgi:hypothetical protein
VEITFFMLFDSDYTFSGGRKPQKPRRGKKNGGLLPERTFWHNFVSNEP